MKITKEKLLLFVFIVLLLFLSGCNKPKDSNQWLPDISQINTEVELNNQLEIEKKDEPIAIENNYEFPFVEWTEWDKDILIKENEEKTEENNIDTKEENIIEVETETLTINPIEEWMLYFSITWKVWSGAKEIEVSIINDENRVIDTYKLTQFKENDTTWKYNLNPTFWNVFPWKTSYEIKAKFKDWSEEKKTIDVNIDKDLFYSQCILDTCLDRDFILNVTEEWNKKIQKYFKNDKNCEPEQREYNNEILPWQYIKISSFCMMDNKDLEVHINWDYIQKIEKKSFHTTIDVNQFNKYWEKIDKAIDKKINLDWIQYINSKINFEKWNANVINDTWSLSLETLLATSKINDDKWYVLYDNITTKGKDWLYINYDLKENDYINYNKSYRDMFWNSWYIIVKNTEEEKLSSIKPISDLITTKKIFDILNIEALWLFYDNWEYIDTENIDEFRLPIFHYYPINANYNLILVSKWYKIESMWWLWKPAVYIYDKTNTINKMEIIENKNIQYTHLDPEMNIENWWKFNTKDWKIFVNNKEYGYLYYAWIVEDYEMNNNWNIILWKDVKDYFTIMLKYFKLKPNEIKDFNDFWLKKFDNTKYYLISFKLNKDIDKYIELKFNTEPETQNRIVMEWISLPYQLSNYNFSNEVLKSFDKYEPFVRSKNIDVLEWWWVIIDWKNVIIE